MKWLLWSITAVYFIFFYCSCLLYPPACRLISNSFVVVKFLFPPCAVFVVVPLDMFADSCFSWTIWSYLGLLISLLLLWWLLSCLCPFQPERMWFLGIAVKEVNDHLALIKQWLVKKKNSNVKKFKMTKFGHAKTYEILKSKAWHVTKAAVRRVDSHGHTQHWGHLCIFSKCTS